MIALGFDFGRRRIGVAVGNDVTGRARPLAVIGGRGDDPDWEALGRLIAEWQPQRLVVGLPRRLDGGESDMTRAAARFARRLEGRFGLPVETVDERLSSRAAAAELADARRSGLKPRRVAAGDVDKGAAMVILQSWLDATRGAG